MDRVARGAFFADAFELETGETPDEAAAERVAGLPSLDELDSGSDQRLVAVDRHHDAGTRRLRGHVAQAVATAAPVGRGGCVVRVEGVSTG